jgi:adenylylsulfate kinase
MIYWFTGQPGHGKTVLCNHLKEYLEKNHEGPLMHIDGDDLRDIFKNKDYSKEGRIKNITFAQGLAKFLNNKGFTVLVSLVAPYRDVRESFKETTSTFRIMKHQLIILSMLTLQKILLKLLWFTLSMN